MRKKSAKNIVRLIVLAALAGAPCCLAQENQKVAINAGVGIRTLKLKALRDVRNELEELSRSNFERSQTFGEHFNHSEQAYKQAVELMNATPSDYEAVEKALFVAREGLRWIAENEPKRAKFLLNARKLEDRMLDLREELSLAASDESLAVLKGVVEKAQDAFEKGQLDSALGFQKDCSAKIDERVALEVSSLLVKAKELSEKENWKSALDIIKSAAVLDPENTDMKVALEEARSHVVTTLKVVVTVNGESVPADVFCNGEWSSIPDGWDVEKGSDFTAQFVYAKGVSEYYAATAKITCDWTGTKTETVELKSVTGPETRKNWNIVFGGEKRKAEMEFCFIRSGSFTMGHAAGEQSGEQLHSVELRDNYWIGKYEVTQEQWLALMENNPSFNQENPKNPVDNVSWDDAMLFCRKLTNQERLAGRLPEGYVYTLPTEAQWEYACRAGSVQDYSFGDDDLVLTLYGNIRGIEDGFAKVAPVGKFRGNAWGLHDMHGNLSEWCLDLYATYTDVKQVNPTGPAEAELLRIHRGGDWEHDSAAARSAIRDFSTPSFHDECIGFRVALVRVGK